MEYEGGTVMENLNISDFIKPELLVVAVMLYVLGMIFKSASFIKDKFIPLLLGVTGIVLAFVWIVGSTEIKTLQDWLTAVYTGVVQGILCAGAAVYAHQTVKQLGKNE